METVKVIQPKGKRKNKIILRTTYNPDYIKGGDLDQRVAKLLGDFNFFGG